MDLSVILFDLMIMLHSPVSLSLKVLLFLNVR